MKKRTIKPVSSFWHEMTHLAATGSIVIDRPKGRTHPRYPEVIFPLNYGYLENTRSSDCAGINAWPGSLSMMHKTLTGILCTFDTLKRDAEIKLLIGCTEEYVQIIQEFHKEMHSLSIPNPMVATK